jgi:osmoprotectant transport system ATP-binding protein
MHLARSMIAFRQASFNIGSRRILDNIDLEVAPGETLVFLGRSGSGKTTALRLVNATLMPTGGAVYVDGRPTTKWDPIELRRRTGYVIQEVGLLPHYTVTANIGLVPRLQGMPKPQIDARVRELLEQVGLDPAEFAGRYPRQLSGGQRQRVGVARALAADPPVLLFDEPFGALDPVTRDEAQRQFLALRTRIRKTSLFVTHDVREALRLASRIALMQSGRLALVMDPSEFVKSTHPEARAFLACLE